MTNRFRFGVRSERCLLGVHADLVRVVRAALAASEIDFAVIEGVRSQERQRQLYAQGRTAPGAIVTWSLYSRHLTGHAVDLAPVNLASKKIDWSFSEGFREISRAMFEAANSLGIAIRWGRDWDRDGIAGERGETDSPHFELLRSVYP